MEKTTVKKNDAHFRRIDRLKNIGFSNADIRWILNWAFDEKNKNIIKDRFMPNIVHIISGNIKKELDKVLELEENSVYMISDVDLKFAENRLLYDIIRVKRPDLKVTSVRDKPKKFSVKKPFNKREARGSKGLVSMADLF